MQMNATGEGKLVIVPTPLGNLGDMTARSLEALRAADVVCAEDTRVTGKLLAAFDIEKRLERLDEALIGARAEGVVERVLSGEVIAYCSDAGMPGVSDPGLRLVSAARAAGAQVEVLPGPVAAATAYVASGCTNPRFYRERPRSSAPCSKACARSTRRSSSTKAPIASPARWSRWRRRFRCARWRYAAS